MNEPLTPDHPLRAALDDEQATLTRVRMHLATLDLAAVGATDYDQELLALRDQLGEARMEDVPALVDQMLQAQAVRARRGLYDETMAHQDRELARFVERLKAEGEWDNTLLVIGADHGHPAGTFARFGRGLIEPRPESWQGALFDSYSTRVPLIVIWPRKIPGGRRIEQAVSMIDVLPTILDLAGLPQPEIAQGRSLAPLCLGGELAARPVILDEFRVDEASGELIGKLEIIDGLWGASLEIAPVAAGADGSLVRHPVPA